MGIEFAIVSFSYVELKDWTNIVLISETILSRVKGFIVFYNLLI
jgi:hypothetical protein